MLFAKKSCLFLILHGKTMNLGRGNTKIASLFVALEGEMASFCAEAAAAGLLSAPLVYYQSQGCYQLWVLLSRMGAAL